LPCRVTARCVEDVIVFVSVVNSICILCFKSQKKNRNNSKSKSDGPNAAKTRAAVADRLRDVLLKDTNQVRRLFRVYSAHHLERRVPNSRHIQRIERSTLPLMQGLFGR
jgi:hypothetical protein